MKKYTPELLRLHRQALGAVCVALVLGGCASASIQSAKDPSFSDPIHKLFIILNHGYVDKINSSYTPFLIAALKDEFSHEGVDVAIKAVDSLTSDEKGYPSEINSYEPDGIMTVVAVGGVEGAGGAATIIYDVSIFDAAQDKKRIWRAQIYSSGGALVKEKRMKILAQDLVKRLSEDKMISSEPRKGRRV